MTLLLNHNTDETIAADFELSERLGEEIEADPTPGEPCVKPTRRYMTTTQRKVNLVTGLVTYETVTEAV